MVFSLPQQQIGTVVEQMNGPGKLAVTALDRNQDKVLAEGTLTTLDNQIDTTTGTVKLRHASRTPTASCSPTSSSTCACWRRPSRAC